jgi:hypothetical protein
MLLWELVALLRAGASVDAFQPPPRVGAWRERVGKTLVDARGPLDSIPHTGVTDEPDDSFVFLKRAERASQTGGARDEAHRDGASPQIIPVGDVAPARRA